MIRRSTLLSVSSCFHRGTRYEEPLENDGIPATCFAVDAVHAELARHHALGVELHATAACAPGILDLLAPVRASDGLVLELGCGTGLLTKELIAAGHRVIATDASPAMLEVARGVIEGRAEEVHQLTLPDDALPETDAIVAIGHPISYLPDADAIDRALEAMAGALRPGGLLAIDVCDLDWGKPAGAPPTSAVPGRTGRSSPSSRCRHPIASSGT